MASLTLLSRHIIYQQSGSSQRHTFTGWTKAAYQLLTDATNNYYKVVTMFEPLSLTPLDSIYRGGYEFSGFMLREGSDMIDLSCTRTSKATGGNLLTVP